MNSKLKPMDFHLPNKFFVHLVFVSLPNQFETFVVNYNMQLENWDLEKTIAMCVQEEEIIKAQHGGSVNYVHNKRKKAFHAGSSSKAKDKPRMQQNYQPKNFTVDKDRCRHCKEREHYVYQTSRNVCLPFFFINDNQHWSNSIAHRLNRK